MSDNEKKEYISISDFKNLCEISEKTIIRNIHSIPGFIETNDGYKFLKGTRYPYNLRNTKLTDSAKKRYVLLKAISQYRYIDHRMLRIDENDFILMLHVHLQYIKTA